MTRTTGVLLAIYFFAAGLTAPAQVQNYGALTSADQSMSQPETIQSDTPSLGQFGGSGIVDKLVPGGLRLSILDAMERGIKHNLGLLVSQEQSESARAERLRNLSALLPQIEFNASETIQQINLAGFGIPITVNGSVVVGPFAIVNARPSMTQKVLDLSAVNRLRAAAQGEKAANFTVQDARELVVLVVGNEYLLVLAAAARVDTAKAQLATAQAIFQQAQDQKKAGVVAGIDVLRTQVQMQEQQQQVLSAQNNLDKQKMNLGRVIGFPALQQFELIDKVPYAPLQEFNLEEALARAYTRRPEYLAAQARVRAAEIDLTAARQERLPTLDLDGDFGILGPSVGTSHETYSLAAGVKIPVFEGNRVRSDVLQAQSNLNQLKSQLEDLHARIEYDVRTAMLDIKTSNDQVIVAQQSVDLAGEQLKQAQDRYAAGVTNSLEVVQSQEAVAVANETYIGALYLNNISKLTLARALGVAEQQTREFLGGK